MRLCFLTLFALAGATELPAQSHADDSVAILRVIARRLEAARARNARLERTIYAPNAVWINAFGTRREGVDSIGAFLDRLYADPGYGESRMTRSDPPEVIFIRRDAAVVHEYHEREGQRQSNNTVIPIRRIHTTFVLTRESGQWLVRYQHIMDERERADAPARR